MVGNNMPYMPDPCHTHTSQVYLLLGQMCQNGGLWCRQAVAERHNSWVSPPLFPGHSTKNLGVHPIHIIHIIYYIHATTQAHIHIASTC